VPQPDRALELPDLQHAKEKAKTLLAERALGGLPREPSTAFPLQDGSRMPILTFRLVLQVEMHGRRDI
jgi:hypothetical protein